MTLKNSGNLNNEIGLPLTLLRAGKGHEAAVLEMGFYVPGEIKLLCDIARPQIGVFFFMKSISGPGRIFIPEYILSRLEPGARNDENVRTQQKTRGGLSR